MPILSKKMKKKLFIIYFIIIICLFYFFSPQYAKAIKLEMNLDHFAQDMEFYYQNPRPEIIEPLLKHLYKSKVLMQADKRLMIAAFLGELARKEKINLAKISKSLANLSRPVRHTIAWGVHLARLPDEEQILNKLLNSNDEILKNQIKKSPGFLENWTTATDPVIIQMYWGAFMASGKPDWIDTLIKCTFILSEHPGNDFGNKAAASLYEYAPRHKIIEERIKYAARSANPGQISILNTILENCR